MQCFMTDFLLNTRRATDSSVQQTAVLTWQTPILEADKQMPGGSEEQLQRGMYQEDTSAKQETTKAQMEKAWSQHKECVQEKVSEVGENLARRKKEQK